MCGPVLGPNSAIERLVGRLGELEDGLDAEAGEALGDRGCRCPRAPWCFRWPITSNQLSRVSRNMPRGLPNSVAILARTLVSPMPTEQCSPVAASTSAWIVRATASGSSVSMPTNASSQPSTSTTAPGIGRRVSITTAEAASYAGASTGSSTASGQRRTAVLSGIPERTPNSRAS